jgi:uncharacterized DUF497 family protein
MKLHDGFEWNPKKAQTNARKHGVTFDDAAVVLGDDQADVYHIERYDDAHSLDEDRSVTIGSHPADRSVVLYISWTDRSTKDERITHIISVRVATKRERKQYASEISERLGGR